MHVHFISSFPLFVHQNINAIHFPARTFYPSPVWMDGPGIFHTNLLGGIMSWHKTVEYAHWSAVIVINPKLQKLSWVAKAIFVCLDTFWIDLRILSLFLNIHMNPISSWDSSPADTSCHIVDLSHHCLQITTSMWFLGMMVAHWDLKLWGSFLRSLVNILTHTLMHSAQVSNR